MFGEQFSASPMRDAGVEKKFGTLLFLTHLDVGLRRAYAQIRHKASKLRAGDGGKRQQPQHKQQQQQQQQQQHTDDTTNWSGVPELELRWRIYRQATGFIHLINGIKYTLVLIMLDGTLIKQEANCYLLGRLFANHELSDYLIVFSWAMSFFILAWRYVMLGRNFRFEMDIMVFMMHKPETIKKEICRMVELNSCRATSNIVFPQNILQKVLFYEHNMGDNSRANRSHLLRPNRTEKARKLMLAYLNRIVIFLIVITIAFATIIVPVSLRGNLSDATYIRTYPGCCPQLELMASQGTLDSKQKSFNLCTIKRVSFVFDLIDNFIIFFDAYLVLVLPLSVASIITFDLRQYWQWIDLKSGQLVDRLRFRNSLYPDKEVAVNYFGCHNRSNSVQQLEERLMRGEAELNMEDHIRWLQSVLVDFFDCVGRADKFVNMMLSFSMGLFVMAMIFFGYFGWNVENFPNLIIARFLFVLVVFVLIAGSSITLQLKRIIDRSYVNLCSIMAHDRSELKSKWITILECYTYKKRNSFTLLANVRFSWMFVLNLAASSVSFLLAVATLKEQQQQQQEAALL